MWEPAPITIKGRSIYYVSFINDYSHCCSIYLTKRRSDFLSIYRSFRELIRTQHSSVIKCFKFDLGGEYTSIDFSKFLTLDGTIYQTPYNNTPQLNGIAKRKYTHIVKIVRSLLLSAKVF